MRVQHVKDQFSFFFRRPRPTTHSLGSWMTVDPPAVGLDVVGGTDGAQRLDSLMYVTGPESPRQGHEFPSSPKP